MSDILLAPLFLLFPTLLGMVIAVFRFFTLPLRLIDLKLAEYPVLTVFGALISLFIIGVCVYLAFQKNYQYIPFILCLGFVFAALYGLMPDLLGLKQKRG